MQTAEREPRVKQSVALRRAQLTALRALAAQERHGNISLIVQRAVDRELERCERREADGREVAA